MAINLDQLVPDTELTVRHLVLALGHALRYENAQNALGDYWRLRLQLLSDSFELPKDWHRDKALYLLSKVAVEVTRPGIFAGLLEYPFEEGEAAIYRRHMPNVLKAEEAVSAKLMQLGEDLLMAHWPVLKSRAVELAILVEAGLPPVEPDPVDFI